MFKSNLSIIVFLAAVAGGNWLAASYLVPEPSIDIEIEKAEDNWQLPKVQFSNDAIVLNSKLKKFQPWGKTKKKKIEKKLEEKKPKKPTYAWKLVGIVGSGKDKYILAINGKTQKIENYQLKEELPDGSRLLAIHANEVSIEQEINGNFKIQHVKLHEPPQS